MDKVQLGPGITFFPQPATWIATVDANGRPNLMTASWVALVSKTPPTIAISLHHGRQSYSNIHATGVFTVNVIAVAQVVAGDYCGLTSGRTLDKVETSGLTLTTARHVAAPLVVESPLNLECKVSGETVIGDYRLILGEVLQIHALAAACHDGQLDPAIIDPLVYLGGVREYWSLGSKVGTAYSVGKSLIERG